MLKVGLTGGLASGKSFVAARLAELGCRVLSADRLGHEALMKTGGAYQPVLEEFGRNILDLDGEINRKALGAIVFADPSKLQKLNSLVHPQVFANQEKFFTQVEGEDPAAIVVVEAAIMIETGSYQRYDRLIVAWCPESMQIKRFIEREQAGEPEARARLARQMPIDQKKTYADYLIDTSGAKQDTLRQVDEVFQKLKKESLK